MGDQWELEDINDIKEQYKYFKIVNEYNVTYNCRRINIPETLSEGLTCALFKWYRTNGSGALSGVSDSGDTLRILNDGTGEIIQIKSYTKRPSGAGPSSFGPCSQYDKLIALEVDLDNNLFTYYDLSDIDIEHIYVSKTETFAEQSESKRRPRIRIDIDIIKKFGIKPFAQYNLDKEEFVFRDKGY